MLNNILWLDGKTSTKKPNTVKDKSVTCPFCENQINQIIEEGLMLNNRGHMFWAKNKFPTLQNTYQTLIVETTKCGESLSTYSLDYAKELFQFIFECRNQLLKSGKYKEVLFFKNHGLFSDSSISHSHCQLIGLMDQSYDYRAIEESIKGPIIHKTEELFVSISQVPRAEFFEFNVVWSKDSVHQGYVHWVQEIIKYLQVFKNGRFDSYNLVFHETNDQNIMKIVPRKASSIYFIGFGMKQSPLEVSELANEFKEYLKENNKS